MSEGEVVAELVEFTNILLIGVSLIFSVVSAYVVALNYFIGEANFLARLGSFAFISLVLGMLLVVMMGAEATHIGLIARLTELDSAHQLTAAGRALLANASAESGASLLGGQSIDEVIRLCVWLGLGFIYVALAYLTFMHRWTTDVISVALEPGRSGR